MLFPAPTVPQQVQEGDIWRLGQHLLLIGGLTSDEVAQETFDCKIYSLVTIGRNTIIFLS